MTNETNVSSVKHLVKVFALKKGMMSIRMKHARMVPVTVLRTHLRPIPLHTNIVIFSHFVDIQVIDNQFDVQWESGSNNITFVRITEPVGNGDIA